MARKNALKDILLNKIKNYTMSPYVIPGLPQYWHCKTDSIITECCIEFGITTEQIKLKTRRTEIVVPRMAAIYLMRQKLPHFTLKQIGKIFDFDHTTIINAIKIIKNEIFWDTEIAHKVEKINK